MKRSKAFFIVGVTSVVVGVLQLIPHALQHPTPPLEELVVPLLLFALALGIGCTAVLAAGALEALENHLHIEHEED